MYEPLVELKKLVFNRPREEVTKPLYLEDIKLFYDSMFALDDIMQIQGRTIYVNRDLPGLNFMCFGVWIVLKTE